MVSLEIWWKRCVCQDFLQCGRLEIDEGFWQSQRPLQDGWILDGSHIIAEGNRNTTPEPGLMAETVGNWMSVSLGRMGKIIYETQP